MAALFVAGLPLSVDGRVGAQGPPAEPPATPTGLTGTFTHESVSLSWDDPRDPSITGYQILRRERGVHEVGDFQIHVDDTNSAATSYVDTAVEAEASYVYRVKARNSSGLSERSRFFRADLPAAPDPPAPGLPDPPTNLTAAAAGETQLDLSWTAPEDTNGSEIVGYRIEVSTDAGTSWTDLIADTSSTVTTYAHTGLESGATRHYRTSAINSVGTGAPSNVASATTDDLTPPGFVAAVVGADGDSLELYFNEPLDLDPGRTPRASSFGLTADGAAIAVGAVQVIPGRAQSVSLIGLSPAIREGQTASVSYTDPTSGNDEAAIQDRAGNDAASLADQPVTNGSTLTGASTRGAPAQDVVTQPATATATAQIGAILAAKAQRTPTQRKVSSRLLDAMGSPQLPEGQEGGGEEPQPPAGSGPRQPAATDGVAEFELVAVDIRADVTPEVLGRIRALGGTVINSVPKYRAIRAQLPLVAVQPLAALSAVQSIRPADEAVTHKDTSEGVAAHAVNTARTTHGVTGSGIGIGVISDGVATLAARQASGDLPAQVAVLPGQEGSDDDDEGTAMLEIVHDLAPGAELYFATGFTGQAQFAANIEALCEAGADVIVDDLSYHLELSFQDSIIAQGVNAATANGCYYFSAAGNSGNLNNETSGVWEGDYVAGTPMIVRGSTVGVRHDFGGGKEENAVRGAFLGRAVLQWADPLGASANDYDLFLVYGDGTVLSSTDTQDGTQDPIETVSLKFFPYEDVRLVIVKVSGEARYLRLQLFPVFPAKLEIATAGATYGHSASENTVGVGQVDVRTAGGAGGIFDGTESVMAGSSDGPRRLFYEPDGTPITPDDFSSTGGKVLKKPDLSAASCVSTATPGFSTFCGTSAAAPHAAAIAALMLAAAGGPAHVTPADLRTAMTATTAVLDIEQPGFDNNSGAGIVMAPGAIAGVAVAVADRNGAPTAASALTDRTLVAGLGAVTIDLASIFTDPDSDALTYSVVSSAPHRLGVTLSGTEVTLTPGAPGWSAVWARVTDPGGLGALQTFTVTVTAGNADYDTDNDRLIEVSTLAQLDAIRYDLNGNGLVDGATWEPYYAAFSMGALEMGCPDRCIGYELAANLDFDTDGSGTTSEAGDTYWNDGAGWEPIGSEDNPYIANFWGESHTLANLFINRPTEDGIGLFGELGYAGTNGHISDVGLVEVDVTGRDRVGALFGRSMYMTVFKSYATGRVTGRGNKVGGLAGESWGNLIHTYAAVEVSGLNLDQPPPSPPITCPPPCALVSGEARSTGGLVGLNLGVINSSYATGDVTGYPAGGLVGWNSGGFISTSYATGAVTGTTVGGLVGRNDGPGRISISYATGRVSGNRDVGGLIGTNASIIAGNYSTGPVSATSSTGSSVGGLVGANESAFGRITESYWDSTTSGIAGARGLSTAALQGPTGLDGIYQNWSGRWHFGTSSQYPALSVDFDGDVDGDETWQEFGHQLRAGPELTATGGIEQVVLDWPRVDAGHWTPAPGITYTLYRDATVVAENLSTLSYQDSGLTAGTYTYQVAAVVDGGEATRSALVTGTVTEVGPNNEPQFPSSETGARSVDENTAASRNIGTAIAAADADNDALTYSISGADAALFDVVESSGQLQTSGALDHESRDTYSFTMLVRDGKDIDGNADTADDDAITVTVTVVDVDEAPDISFVATGGVTVNNNALSVDENYDSTLATFTAEDPERKPGLTYEWSVVGTDRLDFTVTDDGVLSFAAIPDHEDPADSGGNNVYDITVKALDSDGEIGVLPVTVTVTPVNEAPAITGNAAIDYAENGTGRVGSYRAQDPEGEDVTWLPLTGNDAGFFLFNSGELTFSNAPDFEARPDNTYEVTVRARDEGGKTGELPVTVTVVDVDEAPKVMGPEAVTKAENSGTFVGRYTATDPENEAVTWTTLRGADAGHFAFDNGALSFVSEPDFEARPDNTYEVTVRARDESGETGELRVTVTVRDVNEVPEFPSTEDGMRSVPENTPDGRTFGDPVAAVAGDNDTLTYSITRGANLFGINTATGQLLTKAPLDRETAPSHTIRVGVSDGKDTRNMAEDPPVVDNRISVTITVDDVDEAPKVMGPEAVTKAENSGRSVGAYTATDPENKAVTWTTLTGADARHFAFDNGALSFVSKPDFEARPDNTYEVTVRARDEGGKTGELRVTVTVRDVNEVPEFPSTEDGMRSVPENTPVGRTFGDPVAAVAGDNDTLTYSITSGADLFGINTATGHLFTKALLDREVAISHTIRVGVSDGKDANGHVDTTVDDTITVTVTVVDVDEAPDISFVATGGVTVNDNALTVDENYDDTLATFLASDPETKPGLTYEWSVVGTDRLDFTVTDDGVLSFVNIPNYERPADSGGNNVYNVTVRARDSDGETGELLVTVTVTPVNEVPAITGNAAIDYAENGTGRVGSYRAQDPEGEDVTWLPLTGNDAGFFLFSSGELTFSNAPDFEARPDNTYEVTVRARDDSGHIGELPVTVTVDDVDEAPEFPSTEDGMRNVPENTLAGRNVGDPVAAVAGDNDTLTYSITSGANLFGINTATGQLLTKAPLDRETAPSHTIRVGVSDGKDTRNMAEDPPVVDNRISVTITVDDVDEAPKVMGPEAVTKAENSGTFVGSYTATDPENKAVTWTTLTGADARHFAFDNGALSFVSEPDFEARPDNTYEVTVRARDESGETGELRVTVTVLPVNERPTITGDAAPSIEEAGTLLVGTYGATDPEGATIAWQPLAGSDAGKFEFNTSNGRLTFEAAPNFEDTERGGDNEYRVTLGVSAGGHTTTFDVAVSVTNKDEGGALSFSSPQPQADADYTATLSDADQVLSTTWTWERSRSRSGPWDAVDGASDGVTTSVYTPDTDDVGYFLRVTAAYTDGHGPNKSRVLVSANAVKAAPVTNEPPSFDEPTPTRSIAENARARAAVGRPVTATDPNSGDVLTYELTGSDLFTIDSNSGQIRVAADESLDHETAPSHRVTVTASDSSTASDTVTVTITVDDVNEPPTAEGDSADTREDSEVTIDVVDNDSDPEDERSALTLLVATPPRWGSLVVNASANPGDRPTITYTPRKDYNGADSFEYRLRDTGGLTDTALVAIDVIAVNDAPTFASAPPTRSVSESAEAGDNVGAPVTATDVDENDTLTYSLFGANASSFEIDSNGQITVATGVTFDIATRETYTVTVDAYDGTDAATVEVTITVTAGPVGPPIITGGGGGGFAGGGGGGGGAGPSPSEVEFEWNVTRDIDELDGGQDKPSGQWSDGATLWILENGDGAGDAVYAYDLATGERVEEREFELDEANRAPRGVSSDRTTLWISDSGQEKLFAHDLETGERLPERDIALAERNRAARGIWTDGETMWVLDGGKDALFAYDLESGELLAEYALDSANDDPHGLFFDGVTFWVSDHGEKRLFAYRLKAGEDGEDELERNRDEEFPSTVLSRASNNSPRGIWSDGEVMYVADESDDKVYSYNMPDAIDARLASLTLSGADIGEFSPGQTDYEGVAADGVTETTVEAEATQRRATVIVSPSDADGDPENGHQVAVEAGSEITVTVTSADGNRTRVYRVRFGGPEHEAPSDPTSHCFRGDVVEGFSLLIYEGGSLENFVVCAASRYVVALYVLDHGVYVPYIVGAPDFVNGSFHELYPDGVLPLTPLVAGSDGPPSGGHVVEGLAQDEPATLRGSNCLYGEIATGFSLAIFEGGSVEELEACGRGFGIAAFYALHEGDWVPFVLGATDLVNRPFFGLYDDGLPALTPLVAKRDSPPAANADSGDAAEN